MDVPTVLSSLFCWRRVSLTPGGPPIPTSLTAAETATLQQLARGGEVIELGSAMGYSTVAMALVATHVTAVDPHSGIPGSRVAFLRNLQAYGVSARVTLVNSTSAAYCQGCDHTAAADLVFIDGDHSYPAALHDLRCASRLVRPSGAIAIHDYARIDSVRRAVGDWSSAVPRVVDSLAVFSPACGLAIPQMRSPTANPLTAWA